VGKGPGLSRSPRSSTRACRARAPHYTARRGTRRNRIANSVRQLQSHSSVELDSLVSGLQSPVERSGWPSALLASASSLPAAWLRVPPLLAVGLI